jgi:HTH-type transcriptional regulator, sugar sensing transcriptional regulator
LTHIGVMAKRLQDLGFTLYEARAYVSLLEHHPVTRYELSKNSGVPRSAIYNVILELEEMGVVSLQTSDPETYVPLPADKLFDLLDRRFNEKIEEAQKSLVHIENKPALDQFWNIVGYDNMLLKAEELIQKAEKTIFISLWKREFILLEKDLEDAIRRKVKVIVFSFTDVRLNRSTMFCYGLDERELEKIWPHRIILIRDRKELLMGDSDRLRKKKTVWTSNPSLIDVAINHIIMDITLYGNRLNQSVDDTIIRMQNGETDYLGKLLKSKYPQIKF